MNGRTDGRIELTNEWISESINQSINQLVKFRLGKVTHEPCSERQHDKRERLH